MEYVIEILRICAWPLTVCLAVLVFRNDIHAIVGRISTIRYKNLEATLSGKIRDAQNISRSMKKLAATKDSSTDELAGRLYRILEISPKAAILEAWSEIEAEAFKNDTRGSTRKHGFTPLKILEFTEGNSGFSQKELQLLTELRSARNNAAHLPDIIIEKDDAERYIEIALKAVIMMRQK